MSRHPDLTRSTWVPVDHNAAWVEVVALWNSERKAITAPDAGASPPVTDTGVAEWAAVQDNPVRQRRTLVDEVAGLDPVRPDKRVPGRPDPLAVMLHTTQHDAHHAGLIAPPKEFVAR